MATTPAARLLTANAATASEEKPSAVSTFPANTSLRLQERVSTVVHVRWRSSAENKSPPTTLVITGNSHNAANPRTTRGVAKPDSFTLRPKRVSSGRLVWTRIAATKANGPATHAAS